MESFIILNNNNFKLLQIINYFNSLKPNLENEIVHFKNRLKTENLNHINNINFYTLNYIYLKFEVAQKIAIEFKKLK